MGECLIELLEVIWVGHISAEERAILHKDIQNLQRFNRVSVVVIRVGGDFDQAVPGDFVKVRRLVKRVAEEDAAFQRELAAGLAQRCQRL